MTQLHRNAVWLGGRAFEQPGVAGAARPAAKLRDGRLWFPAYGGALIVDPAKQTRNLRPPPVIACHRVIITTTAHAIKGDAEQCLEAGMDAYASKPIHAAELLAAIHALVPARELTKKEERAHHEGSAPVPSTL